MFSLLQISLRNWNVIVTGQSTVSVKGKKAREGRGSVFTAGIEKMGEGGSAQILETRAPGF